MKLLLLIIVAAFTPVQGWTSVKAYFNHNQNKSYQDPYRKMVRPGDNLERVIINQIKSAKSSIYLAVQELRLPLVAKALVEKKKEGIDVRVVLEHDYNASILSQDDTGVDQYEATRRGELQAFIDLDQDGKFSKAELETRDAIYMLKAAKIKIMDDKTNGVGGSGLMHHKFIIVDGLSVLVSSANFTMSCIHGDFLTPKSLGNPNSLVVIKSKAVAAIFNEEFMELWGDGKLGKFGQNKSYRAPQTVKINNSFITIQFSPTSARLNWEDSVNGLAASYLARSTESIKAALFVFSDQNFSNIMGKRHRAGVEVGVLVEAKFAYRDYSELLDLMGLKLLTVNCEYEPANRPWKKRATEVGMAALPGGDIMHHKFAVIDNNTVIVGSQNWSESANFVNDETLIVIENHAISDQYTQEYERLLSTGRLGAPQTLKDKIEAREADCFQK